MKRFGGLSFPVNDSRRHAISRAVTFDEENDEEVVHVGSSSIEELRCKGNEAALNEEYSLALNLWQNALQMNPSPNIAAILHEQRAQVLMMVEGKLFQAIQAAHKAIELQPDLDVAHLTLGRAQMAYGEFQLAVESLQEALDLGLISAAEDLQLARQLVSQAENSDK